MKLKIVLILLMVVNRLYSARPDNCKIYSIEKDICTKCNDYYFLDKETENSKPNCVLCDLRCAGAD